MGLLPDGDGRGEGFLARGGEAETAATAVAGIAGDEDEAAALEGLEGRGEGGAVHSEERCHGRHGGGLGAVEGHQHGELAVGEAGGAKGVVEAPSEGAGGALYVEAEAAIANTQGRFKWNGIKP